MRFSPEFLDEIRARVPLQDVISKKVRLQKKGREFLGLCPFHNEKTPSFTVSEEKGFFHCFGCGAHGDVIRFMMDSEGTSFPEAIERLASQAGLELPRQTADERRQAERRDSLYDVMDAASRWYVSQLGTSAGAYARRYLESRNLDRDSVARFAIGNAPKGRTNLRDAMQSRGFSIKKLVDAGLLIAPEGGRETYDRFRNRLMFPIRDSRNRVIAFGARALDDAKAKYLNSPETPLFHKGRTLYNLVNARRAAFDSGEIIVVEGYVDAIALAAVGVENVVAPLGTAVTEDQLKILWRMVPEPTLCFDGDSAGMRAAGRAVMRSLPLLQPGKSLRFALLPEGEDPDSLIRSQGRASFDKILGSSLNLADMLWRMLATKVDFSTPERQAGLEQKVFDRLREIQDQKVRRFYQSEFGSRLNQLFRQGRSTGRRGGKQSPLGRPREHGASGISQTRLGRNTEKSPVTFWMEEQLVLTIINHPQLLVSHLEDFVGIEIESEDMERLREAIMNYAERSETLDRVQLKDHLLAQGLVKIYDRLTSSDTHKIAWSAWPEADVSDAETGWLQTLKRHRRVSGLEREYRALEAELADNLSSEGYERLKAIQQELRAESGKEADLEGYGLASGRKMTY
jgi:DNA primase